MGVRSVWPRHPDHFPGLGVRVRVNERLLYSHYVSVIALGALPMVFPLKLTSAFPMAHMLKPFYRAN